MPPAPGLGFAGRLTGDFFDRDKVRRAIDNAAKRAMSKFGAFVRQRARTSIRKRKGVSPPGRPPFSHVGTLRRGILFAFDSARNSVVIGPVPLGSRSGAPERLEYGGTGTVVASRRGGGTGATRRYLKHPYMQPAFEAELPKARELLRNSLGAVT